MASVTTGERKKRAPSGFEVKVNVVVSVQNHDHDVVLGNENVPGRRHVARGLGDIASEGRC